MKFNDSQDVTVTVRGGKAFIETHTPGVVVRIVNEDAKTDTTYYGPFSLVPKLSLTVEDSLIRELTDFKTEDVKLEEHRQFLLRFMSFYRRLVFDFIKGQYRICDFCGHRYNYSIVSGDPDAVTPQSMFLEHAKGCPSHVFHQGKAGSE